jgi:hypothetical protein
MKLTNGKKLMLGNINSQQHAKQLICYADADWVDNITKRESNSGNFFKYLGASIRWTS